MDPAAFGAPDMYKPLTAWLQALPGTLPEPPRALLVISAHWEEPVPTVQTAGIDLIWFGIFIVIVVEMAQITPPVGFNLFVMQGMTGRDIGWIARATAPFFMLLVVGAALLVAFPGIATWLPAQMRG